MELVSSSFLLLPSSSFAPRRCGREKRGSRGASPSTDTNGAGEIDGHKPAAASRCMSVVQAALVTNEPSRIPPTSSSSNSWNDLGPPALGVVWVRGAFVRLGFSTFRRRVVLGCCQAHRETTAAHVVTMSAIVAASSAMRRSRHREQPCAAACWNPGTHGNVLNRDAEGVLDVHTVSLLPSSTNTHRHTNTHTHQTQHQRNITRRQTEREDRDRDREETEKERKEDERGERRDDEEGGGGRESLATLRES